MDYQEAKEQAIAMGALKPQGMRENIAAGIIASNGRSFAQTPLAQSRLEAWTQAILRGEDPRG